MQCDMKTFWTKRHSKNILQGIPDYRKNGLFLLPLRNPLWEYGSEWFTIWIYLLLSICMLISG